MTKVQKFHKFVAVAIIDGRAMLRWGVHHSTDQEPEDFREAISQKAADEIASTNPSEITSSDSRERTLKTFQAADNIITMTREEWLAATK